MLLEDTYDQDQVAAVINRRD